MHVEPPKGKAVQFAVVGFALLGVWLILLRIAEDLKLLSSHAEATLSFVSGVAVILLVTCRCRKVVASRLVKGVFLFLMASVCAELFLSFSGSVVAWNDVPVIGKGTSTRTMLKHVLLGCWSGSSMLLIYLLMNSSAKSHQELMESEQRFRSFFEQAGVAVGVLESQTGRIFEVNRKYTDLLGYSREELIGRTWMEITHPEDLQAEHDNMGRLLSGEIDDFTMQKRLVHRNGSLIWVQLTVSVIRKQPESLDQHLVIVEDITERKALQEDARRHEKLLAHANRLAMAGEMVTGFAHELNQPLAAISLLAEASIARLKNDPVDYERVALNLRNLSEQSLRAGDIVDRIRKFVRKEDFQQALCRVDVLFSETLSLLNQELSDNGISVDVRVAESVHEVYADRVQIEQVLVNLVHNSVDAISECSSASRRLELAAREESDGFVEMSVRDFGPGMSGESADQVFDAFYSTKSNGMGMGLAICRTIIETHGGHIRMVPHPHQGVTCKFTLPVRDGED